jgi:Ni/Fe-hydrogenase 1 B-type cytochrome subunit
MTAEAPPTGIHGGLDRSRVEIADTGQDIVTVRVWDRVVRTTHWVIFGSVIVLSVTGFYIGSPYIAQDAETTGYLMGWMRYVHAVTAWVFILAVVSRIIWAFIGNRWARWDQFVPVAKGRRHWARETFKYYVFLRKEPPPAVGHNPLAGTTYLVVYVMFLVQIFTGLALQSLADPDGWKWTTAGWIFNFASAQAVRLVHHLIMWTTMGFVIHHVFSAILVDMEERSGLVSSIITGYKRLPRERL